MGFLDRLFNRNTTTDVALVPNSWPVNTYDDSINGDRYVLRDLFGRQLDFVDVSKLSVTEMWQSQPHLRTVVSFLGRNIAHVGVHTFRRQSDDSRVRDRRSPAALLMDRPNPSTTQYELINATVIDRALYDRAYWVLVADNGERNDNAGWSLYRLPPSWVKPINASPFTRKSFDVQSPKMVEPINFPASQVLEWPGYHPSASIGSVSPIETLKSVLQEQANARAYRLATWQNGGKVSAAITRPADAPPWSDTAKERFKADWNRKYVNADAEELGGTPILEDGMTLSRLDFSAEQQQYVEGTKLSFATVCSVYHVNPTMVGLLDDANYSNVREFRRALYGDTLGPWFAETEARLNQMLLPMIGVDPARTYYEFNLQEKLQGSFEEQAAVMQTMVGVPIMTRNEGRARFNLPADENGDELAMPLNMVLGVPPAPEPVTDVSADAPVTDEEQSAGAPQLRLLPGMSRSSKSAPSDATVGRAQQRVKEFFGRQQRSIEGRLGLKAANVDWWDADRWDRELADDLMGLASWIATEAGMDSARALGYDPSDYDQARTVAFLRAVCERIAGHVNDTTKAAIAGALASDDPAAELQKVWNVAQGQRAALVGAGIATTAAGFGTVEAAQQLAPEGSVTKTWNTGPRARKSHARMNGETVPIDAPFSNGAQWPADVSLGVDEVAGCNCSVTVNVAG